MLQSILKKVLDSFGDPMVVDHDPKPKDDIENCLACGTTAKCCAAYLRLDVGVVADSMAKGRVGEVLPYSL